MSVALMLCVCVTPALCLMYVEQSARTNAIAAPPVRLRCSYIFASKSDSLGKTRGWLKAYPGPKQPFTIYSWGPRRLIFRVLCEVGELACGGWLLLLICAECIPQTVVNPYFWLIPSRHAFMHLVLALPCALFQYRSTRNPQPCLLHSTGLLICLFTTCCSCFWLSSRLPPLSPSCSYHGWSGWKRFRRGPFNMDAQDFRPIMSSIQLRCKVSSLDR